MKLFDFNDISFPGHYLSLQNSGPCNSFYCLGHFKNVYDDDDDDDDDDDALLEARYTVDESTTGRGSR